MKFLWFSFVVAINCLLGSGYVSAQELTLPATGVWNSFNNHHNYLSCNNLSIENIAFTLTLRDNSGSALVSSSFSLAPRATLDWYLNEFAPPDSFGTILIESSGRTTALLSCATYIYRMASSQLAKPLEYAFALPVLPSLTGLTSGVYNSMNPLPSGLAVYNWLSVFNPGTSAFSASIEVYKQNGERSSTQSFRVDQLMPGERRDYALGHPEGQVVGLYRIIPDNTTQSYGAFLNRYSKNVDGSYSFAYPLLALPGVLDSGPVPASTMDPATNWGEVANPTENPVSVLIEVTDQAGTLLHSDVQSIAPFSQYHLYLNQYLGESNIGRFRVRSLAQENSEQKILVQSLFYGHLFETIPRVEWAYASQGRGVVAQTGSLVASPINTFFGAHNWNKYLSSSPIMTQLALSVYDGAGFLRTERTGQLAGDGSLDYGIHEVIGGDFVGLALATSGSAEALYGSELLRVFPRTDGRIGYIMNVPSAIINTASDFDSSSSSLNSSSSEVASSSLLSSSTSSAGSSQSSSSLSSDIVSSSSSSSSSSTSASTSSVEFIDGVPVAVATVNSAQVPPASRVTLDGRSSYDPDNGPDILRHWWTQIGGTSVMGDALFFQGVAQPAFITPPQSGDPALDLLTFELVVFDGTNYSVPDRVSVTIGSCNSGPDSDGDGARNCNDWCPSDPAKTTPGSCGCGFSDADSDGSGAADCLDPVAYNDSYYVLGNRQKFIGLRTLDKTNGHHPPALKDMSQLTFTIVSSPAHGILLPTQPHTTLANSLPSLLYVPTPGYTGGDSFSFRVTDAEGHQSNIAAITIQVGTWQSPLGIRDPEFGVLNSHENYSSRTFNFQPQQVVPVQTSGDDAVWSSSLSWWSSNAPNQILVGSSTGAIDTFLRFPLNIPNGATVRRAYLKFHKSGGVIDQQAGVQSTLIHLLSSLNMPTLSVNRSAMSTLGGPVPWSIDLQMLPGMREEFFTADITPLIQTYINQPGRVSGNYIGLKIVRDSSNPPSGSWQLLNAFSIDGEGGAYAPTLYVTYDAPSANHNLPYNNAGAGPYSHYVDFSAAGSQDVDATGHFNYGTPSAPRRTIPPFLPPGAVVEVHGVSPPRTQPLYITGLVMGADIGGTAASPIFIRGASWQNKTEFQHPIEVRSNYTILENLYVSGSTLYNPMESIHIRNVDRVDHNSTGQDGSITFHHVVLRHCAVRPPTGQKQFVLVNIESTRNDMDTLIHDIVLYDNHVFQNGDWTHPNGPEDYVGVGTQHNTTDIWMLDNHIHETESHNIGVRFERPRPNQIPPTRVYIGRNNLHHAREWHIMSKRGQALIISQNRMHTVMALSPWGSANPDSVGLTVGDGYSEFFAAPDDSWLMFNEIYDVGNGLEHSARDFDGITDPNVVSRSYAIGNIIHDLWRGPRGGGYALTLATNVQGRFVNNTIYNTPTGIGIGSSPSINAVGYIRNNIIADTLTDDRHVYFFHPVGALDHNLYDFQPVLSPQLNVLIDTRNYGGTVRWYNNLPSLQLDGYEQGGLIGDAMFANSRLGDFHLQQQSSAVNAGVEDEAYATYLTRFGINISYDFYGLPRPTGGSWEIGAVER